LPVDAAADMASTPEGASYNGPIISARALIDAGATTTCISTRLAQKLKIQPIGKVPIQGVSRASYHNSYLFMVAFPFPLPPGSAAPVSLPAPKQNEVQAKIHILQIVIHGVEFDPGNAGFDVLLGMDVIRTGTLVVQGDGNFSFSF